MFKQVGFMDSGRTTIGRIVSVPSATADGLYPRKRPCLWREGRKEFFLMRVVPGTPGAVQPPDDSGEHWVAAESDGGPFRLCPSWPAWADAEEFGGEELQSCSHDSLVAFGAPQDVGRTLETWCPVPPPAA